MNEEDKKYLKYLSEDTLGIIQEALSVIQNEDKAKELYNEVKHIVDEKAISAKNVMEMDFVEFKQNLRFMTEVKKATKPSTEENLNVWNFLLNIRHHVKEAKSIEIKSQYSAHDKVYNYRFNMENNEEDCILIVHIPHPTEFKLGIGDAFSLIKNPDTKWVSGSILLKELMEDNPLNLKEEDLETFIKYLDELCDTRRV